MIPEKVRLVVYLAYAVLGPVLIYTEARGWTGAAEYALYVGVGTAVGLTAASNLTPSVHVAPDSPAVVTVETVEPVDPIVSSEGVRFDGFGAPYDAKHDRP